MGRDGAAAARDGRNGKRPQGFVGHLPREAGKIFQEFGGAGFRPRATPAGLYGFLLEFSGPFRRERDEATALPLRGRRHNINTTRVRALCQEAFTTKTDSQGREEFIGVAQVDCVAYHNTYCSGGGELGRGSGAPHSPQEPGWRLLRLPVTPQYRQVRIMPAP